MNAPLRKHRGILSIKNIGIYSNNGGINLKHTVILIWGMSVIIQCLSLNTI